MIQIWLESCELHIPARYITSPAEATEGCVFRKNPPEMFTNSIPVTVRNELLAVGIPALSPAAGKIVITQIPDSKNFNMNTTGKPTGGDWGRDETHTYKKRWLHNDMKDMAYLYTHLLFDKLVDEGDLR